MRGDMRSVRWARPVAVGLTVPLIVVAVVMAVARANAVASAGVAGIDFDTYRAFAQRFLDTGTMYLPAQLAGPYSVEAVTGNVYPPTALYLFVPFEDAMTPIALAG